MLEANTIIIFEIGTEKMVTSPKKILLEGR